MGSRRFDQAAKDIYVETLRETGEPAAAAEACGFTLATVRKHGVKDLEFAEAALEALQSYRATIAAEIHRRAIEGVDEPVFQGGVCVGYKRKYSDALLLAHAKRHMPEEYGDKRVVTHEHAQKLDVANMTPESRVLLRKILELESKANEMSGVRSEDQPEESP